MARGWESKAVEDQMAEAAERKATPAKPAATAADRERASQRQTLQLTRAKLVNDLERARHDRHREALRGAIAALDAQIAQVSRQA